MMLSSNISKRIVIFVNGTSVLSLNSLFMSNELKERLASLGKYEEVDDTTLF